MNEQRSDSAEPDRWQQLLKRGLWVEAASVTYNLIEVGVSLLAAFLSGSTALLTFGFDSFVELMDSGTVLWRLWGEEKGLARKKVRARRFWAFSAMAGAFFILSGYILYDAISKLIEQQGADRTLIGIILLCVSLAINPFMGWGKYEMVLDARDTFRHWRHAYTSRQTHNRSPN